MNEISTQSSWRPIPEYQGYEISLTGEVRSFWRRTGPPGSTFDKWKWGITDVPKVLAQPQNHKGYHMVRLQDSSRKQKLVSVHKLMLEAFVGPRPGPNYHACHIDDNKDRNILSNLEWATKEKNLQSRFVNHGGEKLEAADIARIRDMLKSGKRQAFIANEFGVCQSHISRINSQDCWHYV